MLVCALGLNRASSVTKYMMSALFVILVILIIRAVTLPGAEDGLAFYLMPDFSKMFANGAAGFGDAVYAAMGQSFFTLSIGIGSMEIFGSYLGKGAPHLWAGAFRRRARYRHRAHGRLIIFPVCFAFGVDPGSGPGPCS